MKTVIEMAEEAGFTEGELAFMGDNFIRFAELVRADAIAEEREACAKFFGDNDTNMFWGSQAAEHIRARSNT